MFLSDSDIKAAVVSGDIVLRDFDERRLQPASYDVLLGNKFIITETQETLHIDPDRKIFPKTREVVIEEGKHFVLHPGVSVLGILYDYCGSKKYLIQISGKSSLARIGLIVHNTAGLINPGHFLHITLELYNLNNVPIILRPRMEIAQLTFSKLSGPVGRDYKQTGRYHQNNWNNHIPPRER